jgi:hypothetical protein
MQVYTIIRVYKVPAGSRQQAANRLREALTLQEERDFHVTDFSVSLFQQAWVLISR